MGGSGSSGSGWRVIGGLGYGRVGGGSWLLGCSFGGCGVICLGWMVLSGWTKMAARPAGRMVSVRREGLGFAVGMIAVATAKLSAVAVD